MDHFAGLDVSVKETSVCIVDDMGKIVREVRVASEPEALLQVLSDPAYHLKRIGLEASPLSQWLFSALAEAGLPVICSSSASGRPPLLATVLQIPAIAVGSRAPALQVREKKPQLEEVY
jgi:transposase